MFINAWRNKEGLPKQAFTGFYHTKPYQRGDVYSPAGKKGKPL